jgi:hypothetical protein
MRKVFPTSSRDEANYSYICGTHPYTKGVIITYMPAPAAIGGLSLDITALFAFLIGIGLVLLMVGVASRTRKGP